MLHIIEQAERDATVVSAMPRWSVRHADTSPASDLPCWIIMCYIDTELSKFCRGACHIAISVTCPLLLSHFFDLALLMSTRIRLSLSSQ